MRTAFHKIRPVVGRIPLICLALCFFTAIPAQLLAGDAAETELQKKIDELSEVTLDTGSAANLDNYDFKRDCLEVKFTDGTLYLAKPVDGEVTGAAYMGSGRIKLTPPDRIETEQLKNNIDAEELDVTFSAAFFRFDDDTDEIFGSMMKAGGGSNADKAEKMFEERQNASAKLKNNTEFSLYEHRINGSTYGGMFVGEFDTDEHGWITFVYNPDDIEEVALVQHTKGASLGSTRDVDVWTSFTRLEDREKPESYRFKKNKDPIEIDNYIMDLTVLPNSLNLVSDVQVELSSRTDELNAIRFDFIHEGLFGHRGKMKVESISDKAGNELEFVHRNHQILIKLARGLNKGDTETLRFKYEGDIIAPIFVLGDMSTLPGGARGARQSDIRQLDFLPGHPVSYELLNTYPWFPQYGYLRRAKLEWTVRVPKPNTPVVSGDTIREWEEDQYNCVHAKFDVPVMLASIIFGEFYKLSNEETRKEGAPLVNVFSLAKQKGERKKILEETELVVEYLESLYGEYPYEELDIVQMSFFMGFGQAPPGLVQLTGEAFLTEGQIATVFSFFESPGNSSGFRSPFLAHEIGHQWWGHKLGWRTYHDQWLSEAFTEYSSGMYMAELKGPDQFDEELKGWWDNSMQVKDAGPIYLGGRLGGRKFVYSLYDKGPYMLHMLRMLLVGKYGPDDGTTKFVSVLKNFIDAYPHQNPTTTDLQEVAEQTLGMDMDWFFDQAFRGSGVPKIRFSYDVRKTEDGKWLLEGRIKQDDPETAVKILMPIYYEFGKKQFSDQLIWVDKADFSFKTKLPAEPKKVVLNKNYDVLADIKQD